MIDIESAVFNLIAPTLRETYGAFVTGETIDAPASFPAVSIIETSNTVYTQARTTNIENAAVVMFEVNVYTNRVGYKKLDAKEILKTIDDIFAGIGFTRIMANPISNLQEATIYRIIARYEAVVDKDFWIYQK